MGTAGGAAAGAAAAGAVQKSKDSKFNASCQVVQIQSIQLYLAELIELKFSLISRLSFIQRMEIDSGEKKRKRRKRSNPTHRIFAGILLRNSIQRPQSALILINNHQLEPDWSQ